MGVQISKPLKPFPIWNTLLMNYKTSTEDVKTKFILKKLQFAPHFQTTKNSRSIIPTQSKAVALWVISNIITLQKSLSSFFKTKNFPPKNEIQKSKIALFKCIILTSISQSAFFVLLIKWKFCKSLFLSKNKQCYVIAAAKVWKLIFFQSNLNFPAKIAMRITWIVAFVWRVWEIFLCSFAMQCLDYKQNRTFGGARWIKLGFLIIFLGGN